MMHSRTPSRGVVTTVPLAAVAIGSPGCGGVRARRHSAAPSGFLGDYSRLEKVKGYDFQQAKLTDADQQPQARAQVQNDWARAFAACMEARGYSVR